jgi:hypothetical protein
MKAFEAKLDTPVLASGHLANAGAVRKASFPAVGRGVEPWLVQTGGASDGAIKIVPKKRQDLVVGLLLH